MQELDLNGERAWMAERRSVLINAALCRGEIPGMAEIEMRTRREIEMARYHNAHDH